MSVIGDNAFESRKSVIHDHLTLPTLPTIPLALLARETSRWHQISTRKHNIKAFLPQSYRNPQIHDDDDHHHNNSNYNYNNNNYNNNNYPHRLVTMVRHLADEPRWCPE